MLKKLITKEEWEKLDDHLKALYQLDSGNGKYRLQVEDDDYAELKQAKDNEKRLRLEAEEKLRKQKEAEEKAAEEARKAREEKAKADGDIAALESSWREKYEQDLAAERAKHKEALAALTTVFVDRIARDMAEQISTVPDLLVDRIATRLKLEIQDGLPITRVVDADGKPSAANLDDLRKEFVDNPAFASIIKASNAQGGGAHSGKDGNGVPAKKLSEMSATEEAKFANEHPDAYKKMLEQQGT